MRLGKGGVGRRGRTDPEGRTSWGRRHGERYAVSVARWRCLSWLTRGNGLGTHTSSNLAGSHNETPDHNGVQDCRIMESVKSVVDGLGFAKRSEYQSPFRFPVLCPDTSKTANVCSLGIATGTTSKIRIHDAVKDM